MIDIAGRLINPAFIVSAEVETRASTHTLVIRLADGHEIRKAHDNGFDAFAKLARIRKDTAPDPPRPYYRMPYDQ